MGALSSLCSSSSLALWGLLLGSGGSREGVSLKTEAYIGSLAGGWESFLALLQHPYPALALLPGCALALSSASGDRKQRAVSVRACRDHPAGAAPAATWAALEPSRLCSGQGKMLRTTADTARHVSVVEGSRLGRAWLGLPSLPRHTAIQESSLFFKQLTGVPVYEGRKARNSHARITQELVCLLPEVSPAGSDQRAAGGRSQPLSIRQSEGALPSQWVHTQAAWLPSHSPPSLTLCIGSTSNMTKYTHHTVGAGLAQG